MAFNAYRGFDLIGLGRKPLLASLTANFAWPGPVTVAADITPDAYGIYAYKTLHLLREYAEAVWLLCPVMAEIDIYGRYVYEYKYGYRGHKALIKRLWLRYHADTDNRFHLSHYSIKHGFAYISKPTLIHTAKLLEDFYECQVVIIEMSTIDLNNKGDL